MNSDRKPRFQFSLSSLFLFTLLASIALGVPFALNIVGALTGWLCVAVGVLVPVILLQIPIFYFCGLIGPKKRAQVREVESTADEQKGKYD